MATIDYEMFCRTLKKKRDQYIKDRADIEQQWLINLRQYRGVYDPDILKRIPNDKSKAYPRDTRTKVKGFVAKMMEMMFPAQDKNWSLDVTPYPSLPEDVLQEVLTTLQQEKMAEAQQSQQPPAPLTNEDIERAVKTEAMKRAGKMENEIQDQLLDPGTNWPSICKRVVRSGGIYGAGFCRAPMVRTQKERVWEPNDKGVYAAKTTNEKRPYPEFVKVWDMYPDLSADNWGDQVGIFERMVFSRKTLSDLRDRRGFNKKRITNYLQDNTTGNYKSREYEAQKNAVSNSNISETARKERRYEVFRWIGFCSGAEYAAAAGIEMEGAALTKEYFVDFWLLDEQIIYAKEAVFGDKPADYYHAYIYTEDEEAAITGVGMPEELRDRQMSICAGTRALYDNMASSAGPVYEVARDLLKPNTNLSNISAFTVIEREGDEMLQYPAVRAVNTASHTAELMNILKGEREQMDIESSLPSWMLGNAQPLGEAFRTSSNMSQMTGGGNMVTKDNVRSFDLFTSSVINAFLQWNMEFGKNEDAKGDYQVKARGVESLVAKEVRGAALDQFMLTLNDRERVAFRVRRTLVERLASRDLPEDILLDEAGVEQALQQFDANQAQAAQVDQNLTVAKTRKLDADAANTATATERTKRLFSTDLAKAVAEIEDLLNQAEKTGSETQVMMVDRALQGILAGQSGGTDVNTGGEGTPSGATETTGQ